jgi:hypothetical protein
MDDLIDLMVSNESPSEISDRIKDILMQKSAENIDIVRPVVAASIFGNPEDGIEVDDESEEENEVDEPTAELETEDEYEEEETD